MTSVTIAARLGFGEPGERDDAFAWRCVLAALAVYLVSFAIFYPNAVTNDDESQYLRQVTMVLEGHSSIVQVDAFTGEETELLPSTYPPGLASMMAPFVWLFGWRGAYVVPLLGMLAAVLFTGSILRREGYSPAFALIVLGFVPTLVMSRVAMSDVPSAGIIALGLWCFFRGLDGRTPWWLAAGFVAGASLTLRVSNPLVFAPLFAGTVLRREWRCWALVVGGIAGLGARAAAMSWYFGDALFERAYYPFAPETLLDRLPYYLLGLLVLVPGGIVFGLAYKGRRRPEIVTTIGLFVAFYLFQRFSTDTTGVAKRVVLALRYLIPLLPLLALACAESAPRLWRGFLAGRPADSRESHRRGASRLMLAGFVSLLLACAAVNPAFHRWSGTQAEIRSLIRSQVPLDAVVVTNSSATRKFIPQLERKYILVRRDRIGPEDVTFLVDRHAEVYLVFLDRSESPHWRANADQNAALLEALTIPREILLDEQPSPTDHLRIWRLSGPTGSSSP